MIKDYDNLFRLYSFKAENTKVKNYISDTIYLLASNEIVHINLII